MSINKEVQKYITEEERDVLFAQINLDDKEI